MTRDKMTLFARSSKIIRNPLRKLIPGLALLSLLTIVGGLLVQRALGLLNEVEAANSSSTVEAFRSLAREIGLIVLLGLVLVTQLYRMRQARMAASATGTGEPGHAPYRAWLAGFVLVMGTVAALIIYVDPRGLYGTGIYEPGLVLARPDKIDAYAHLAATPDIVVLGSSRAFTVMPEFFEQDFGYSAFNMAVEGARIEDFVIQTKFILDHDPHNPPKVLLIEINPPLSEGENAIARLLPLRLLPYMDHAVARLAVQARVEGLLDLQQVNEAIYALRHYASHDKSPRFWEFGPDGGGSYLRSYDLKQAVQEAIAEQAPPSCPHNQLSQEGTAQLEQVIRLAEANNISVIFYVTPRHPDYYDQVMAGTRRFQRCQTAIHAYMDDLMERHPFVFFLDYTRLEDIGGVADETGYYDSQHMTPLNNHYLVQAAADTIRQAYNIAMQKRASSH
jgi:hypothetical protein